MSVAGSGWMNAMHRDSYGAERAWAGSMPSTHGAKSHLCVERTPQREGPSSDGGNIIITLGRSEMSHVFFSKAEF